tara:strand:+ start:574 stop:978 length:405 start_codon:yes stop_codon:yes gene_type:complete
MANSALIESYGTFMTTAAPYTMIGNEEQYEATLNELEMAFEASSDTENDPLNPLINMLSHAIEEYEMKDDDLTSFIKKATNIPIDVALIKALMNSHSLTSSDLPEIGEKTLVSKILNGKRVLTRSAIERLSQRF